MSKFDLFLILVGLAILIYSFAKWSNWLNTAPCAEILASDIKMVDVPVRCIAK